MRKASSIAWKAARLAAGCAALLMGAVLAASAEERFGAIAFSVENGAEGYSYDFDTRKEAEARALAECEARAEGESCEIAAWCQNACCALAVGENNGWGGFWGETIAAAEKAAIRLCEGQTKGCKIRRSKCMGK